MKKLMSCAVLFAAAAAFSAEPAPAEEVNLQNPVVKEYAESISFYQPFEKKGADIAKGKKALHSSGGSLTPVLGPAFLGSSMLDGRLRYDGVGNIDFTKPGSVILWIAQKNFPAEKPANGRDPGWGAFSVSVGKSNIFMGKPEHFNWGKGSALVCVTYPGIKQTEIYLWGKASAANWKNFEWHMLAMVWTEDSISFSLDGQPLTMQKLKQKLDGKVGLISVGGRENKNGFALCCDELMIFTKALSNEEILKIYNTLGTAAKEQAAKQNAE